MNEARGNLEEHLITEVTEWIRLARAGDEAAWEEVLRAVGDVVERVVVAHAPSWWRDDWRQEVLLQLFARMGEYQPHAPFAHWVARLAVNVCRDLHREQRRFKRAPPHALGNDLTGIAAHAHGPDTLVAQREWVELLLLQLDSDDRAVLIMLDVEQRRVREVAHLLGRGESWVKTRAWRARQQLRDFARQRGWDGDEKKL